MRKCIILFLILTCILSGCFQGASWELQYGHEHVTEIKLVKMMDEVEFSIIEEIDISHASDLFSDIDMLGWKRYGTNLSTPRDVCFFILYDTGEYDVVSYYEPKHYRFDSGELCAYNSWVRCDYDDFQKLLKKYQQS